MFVWTVLTGDQRPDTKDCAAKWKIISGLNSSIFFKVLKSQYQQIRY